VFSHVQRGDNRRAKQTKENDMSTNAMSPTISNAHEGVAFNIAEEYISNLRKDTDNTFGTLDGLMHTFRHEIAYRVRRRAFFLGATRCNFRPVIFRALAEGHIRNELNRNAELADKLRRIRSAQEAKKRAEAVADQATWAALPVPS
jgi:hypothetical protein